MAAIFNFGGKQVSGDDQEGLEKTIKESGTEVHGSIVGGNSYGITGGKVSGTVHYGDDRDSKRRK